MKRAGRSRSVEFRDLSRSARLCQGLKFVDQMAEPDKMEDAQMENKRGKHIWGFPKIGVILNHPFKSKEHHPFWGLII